MEEKGESKKGIWAKMIKTMFEKSQEYISFSPPFMGVEEENQVVDSLRSGWITTGPKVKEFEKSVARYVDEDHAVATFSCTDAMLIALQVLGVKEGDEVITTPYTFASTGHVICHSKAKPVFVDVCEDTFNIDPEKMEERITSSTKVLLPVHYAGHACDMDAIMDIAKRHNLFVLEDAAHAIGTEYKGQKIGGIGDITCFSFYATKNLTTSEGGMAVTGNKEWADRMRILSMYGISDARDIWGKRYSKAGSIHYDIAELGYKCNMTDICACIGLEQLKKLDSFNDAREKYAGIYQMEFEGHPGLETPIIKPYTKTSRHLYPLLINTDYINIDRDSFLNALKELNIGTSVLFMPLHMHSYYERTFGFKIGDFPIAEKLFESVLCLPISPKLSEEAIKKVAEGVLYLLEKHKR